MHPVEVEGKTVSSIWVPTGSCLTDCWGVPGLLMNSNWLPAWLSSTRFPFGSTVMESGSTRLSVEDWTGGIRLLAVSFPLRIGVNCADVPDRVILYRAGNTLLPD